MLRIGWNKEDVPKITDIKVAVGNGEVVLTFKWPNELETLYIYKKNMLNESCIDWEKPYRKYTKAEYASFGGFKDCEVESAICKYILCPYLQDDMGVYIACYEDGRNEIEVISHRIAIRYAIKERKKLFSSRKLVQMQVSCEVPLPQEYLCYVKKRGSIPVGIEDGMQFQFILDFEAGDNILPEIEIDKDEYIRIYLTDEVSRKEAYHIIKV